MSRLVPVVTPNGGNYTLQNDPNSPEYMLRKIKTVEVQADTDRLFDVPVNPYVKENFCQPHTLKSLLNTPLTPILVIGLRFLLGIVADGRRR